MCSPFSERDVIIIGQRAEIIVRGFRRCLLGGAAIFLGLAEEDLITANLRPLTLHPVFFVGACGKDTGTFCRISMFP